MSAIPTYSGRRVDLLNVQALDITASDTAHALSLICRWSGMTRWHYSVAQHSVLMFDLLAELGVSGRGLRTTLFHDGPEALIGDMPQPLKRSPWAKPYRTLEAQIWGAYVEAFDLLPEIPDHAPRCAAACTTDAEFIRWADNVLAVTEARDLMTGVELDAWMPEPLPRRRGLLTWLFGDAAIMQWTPARAEQEFLDRFMEVHVSPSMPSRERGPAIGLTHPHAAGGLA